MLTSFGHTIDANLVVQRDDVALALTAHRYTNRERSYPGLGAELVRYPVRLRGRPVALSPRLDLWAQPASQRFRTSAASFGGLGALRVEPLRTSGTEYFVELEGKSAGWVAGRSSLAPAADVRFGLVFGRHR